MKVDDDLEYLDTGGRPREGRSARLSKEGT